MCKFKNYTQYIPVSPEKILSINLDLLKSLLIDRLGEELFRQAYQCEIVIKSPVADYKNTEWLKKSKIIGINPRMTGSFINIVKYALSFSENAIHVMPFFETGHQGSLYVQNNWNISQEFFDRELVQDGFDTIEKQLKLTINLLHAMGKTIGFDALPHVDNFSEIVFLYPKFFEWAKLNSNKTAQLFYPEIDYNRIYKEVEEEIQKFFVEKKHCSCNEAEKLFDLSIDEEKRRCVLFGHTPEERELTRLELIKYIRSKGYETLPVTEHSPCRPVIFDKIRTDKNISWAEFKVENKSKDAVILGCVTPYKWYKIDNDNYPDTYHEESEVWEYFTQKLLKICRDYNFDFLRGDMAHNQISNSGKSVGNNGKEFWRYLKEKIQEEFPYFATFAEAFYNTYYIDGYTDMSNKGFDVVLGNLNYQYLDENYINHLKDFVNIYKTQFPFAPCVCVFSNDADKKENNEFYQSPLANEVRIFCAYFFEMPSYMGAGFELRKVLPQKPEEYSFNYIKNMPSPYVWGDNEEMLASIIEMRDIYAEIKNEINEPELKLCKTNNSSSLSWLYCGKNNEAKYLFCFNLDKNSENTEIFFDDINLINTKVCGIYSNVFEDIDNFEITVTESNKIKIDTCPLGSCFIFKIG